MLFDTDVIIWALRGSAKAASVIDKEPQRFISAITYMELLRGSRNKQDQKSIKAFLYDISIELLPITDNISHRAVIYMEEYSLKNGLDLADALIASTAAENSLHLCTSNVKHYKVIAEIELYTFKPS